jgi:hypothetical protein
MICNLPYRRRIAELHSAARRQVQARSNFRTICRLQIGDTADYKSFVIVIVA